MEKWQVDVKFVGRGVERHLLQGQTRWKVHGTSGLKEMRKLRQKCSLSWCLIEATESWSIGGRAF